MTRVTSSESGYQKKRARRWKWNWRHRFLAVAAFLAIAIFVAVPTVLQNRDLAVSLINRSAGIEPMRIEIGAIRFGWFRPLALEGLRLVDDHGHDLVQVEEVQTELTLFSLIANYKNLGTIAIRDATVALDVQPGTTNLEEAFKPWLAQPTPPSASNSTNQGAFTGRILLSNTVVHARDSVDMTSWKIQFDEADIPLPTSEQALPPMTLIGRLLQTSALTGEVPGEGQFTIRTQSLARNPGNPDSAGVSTLRMGISTEAMPLRWVSLIKRRLPDLPIERVSGLATVQAEVEFPSQHAVMANVQTAQVDQLEVASSEWLGPRGASIRQIRLSGDIYMTPSRFSTRGAKLDCDVGSIVAKADFALPIQIPTAAQPWFQDTDLEVQGVVDLPQLTRVAPDLVQMQDQVELLSGVATLNAVQRSISRTDGDNIAAAPSASYSVELGQLKAKVQGNSIAWDQALKASIQLMGGVSDQPGFKVACESEFCRIDGAGDPRDGRVTAQVDFDKMEQRLSQWFVLPLDGLSGSAQGALNWKVDEGNRLVAGGSFRSTPLRIAHRKGMIDEPSWDGEFTSVSRLDGLTLLQIDRAHLSLRSPEESCNVHLLEPLALTDPSPGLQRLPAAGMQVKLTGELARWQRRLQLFGGVDPGLQLAGKCTVEVHGGIDLAHVEIRQADWNMEAFQVTSGEMSLRESRIVGKFAGRVDSTHLASTQVDSLIVQSESLALQAQDVAVPGKSVARQGHAVFRIDPSRMMSSLRWENPSASPSESIRVLGDITGQMNWSIDPEMVRWRVLADGNQLRILQPSLRPTGQMVSTGATSPDNDILWEEPQAKLMVDGDYSIANGKINLPKVQLQTEWLAYGGQGVVEQRTDGTSIVSEGSITYDAATAVQRFRPYLGEMVAVEGQRTQPLDISWESHPGHSWAHSLQATSRLGWERANVIGIPIGQGDIPLEIRDGRFVSQAAFPVSQGTLRWNIEGDLSEDPLAIRQSQERVIENVAITREMCQGWLKFVAPLLADATSVQGSVSLDIERAEIIPSDWTKQTMIGQVRVHGATVGPGPLADQLLMLVQQIRNLRKGAGASDGGGQPTSWLQLPDQSIGFQVEQGRVAHRGLQIQAGDVVMVTSGSVGLDGTLEMVAAVPIQKDWVDKTPALQSLAGQQIQLPIRGTMQRPQLDLNGLAGMTQSLATAALQGAAQKQIDRGLNKILGPLEKQLGPLQQGMQQLPLPNLPIPGFGGGTFGGGPPSPSPVNPPSPPPGK